MIPTGPLIALHAAARLSPGGAPPGRILALKWGENKTAQGPVKIGLRTLAAARLWPGLGFGEVCIDFNHNTVEGHPSYQGEPAKIAAMSGLKVEPGVGLVFEPIKWTGDGLAHRASYKDFSPAVKLDGAGEVIFVHSGALARNGAVAGLHAFSAAAITPALSRKIANLMSTTTGPDKATELEIRRRLGISHEVWERHNGGDTLHALSASGVFPDTRPATETNSGTLNIELLLSTFRLPADSTDEQVNAFLENLLPRFAAHELRKQLGLSPNASDDAVNAVLAARELRHKLLLPMDATDDEVVAQLGTPAIREKLRLPPGATNDQVEVALGVQHGSPVRTLSAALSRITPEDIRVMDALKIPIADWMKYADS